MCAALKCESGSFPSFNNIGVKGTPWLDLPPRYRVSEDVSRNEQSSMKQVPRNSLTDSGDLEFSENFRKHLSAIGKRGIHNARNPITESGACSFRKRPEYVFIT
jgi:hypothetical protein